MITRNINDDNTLAYLFQKSGKEAGKVADEVKAELEAFKAAFTDMVYPVGSIYMSVNSASPETLFGGRWERITGRFLLAATDNGAAGGNSNASIAPGNTGGEAAHVITTEEMAAHTHNSRALTGMARFRDINISDHNPILSVSGIITRAYTAWSGSHMAFGTATKASGYYYTDMTITATHTHDSVGSNTAHNNMPPYLAVYIWKRTA